MSTGAGETIEIQAPDGPAEAYLTGAAGGPGVLMHVDAIGLRPQIRAMADRIASWGYLVLVPHVFYRDGSAAELAPTGDLRQDGAREAFFASGVMHRIAGLTPDRSASDAEAWMAVLLERAGDGPVATTGYCMGAALAVRTAAQFPGTIAAAAGFHAGNLVTAEPDSPHLTIPASTAEFVFGHADHDRSMPPEAVETIETLLTEIGRAHVNEIYAGAVHGYSMADTSMYDESAAERHFTTLQALLARTL